MVSKNVIVWHGPSELKKLLVEIGKLIPDGDNANQHPKENITAIANSLKEFGQDQPLVVRKSDYMVIKGNGRLTSAIKHLNWTHMACVFVDDDKARSIARSIADNRSSELSTWDLDILGDNFTAVMDDSYILETLGFDKKFYDPILIPKDGGTIGDDAAPEVKEKIVSVPGEIYKLGQHYLMCADATNRDNVARLIGGKQIDCVFTDPPYGTGHDKEGQKLGKSQEYGAVLNDADTSCAKKVIAHILDLDVVEILIWGGNYFSDVLPPRSSWVIWDKQGGKHVTYADCEMAWLNTGKPARIFQHIWDGFRRDSEKGEKRFHATQKPIALCIECLNEMGDGKTVLDLFGGSGSTLIACAKTERICYMMELSPNYCDVIRRRWAKWALENNVEVGDGGLV